VHRASDATSAPAKATKASTANTAGHHEFKTAIETVHAEKQIDTGPSPGPIDNIGTRPALLKQKSTSPWDEGQFGLPTTR
jgi:hypothetical protein